MSHAEKLAVVRDKMQFFGWSFDGSVDRGDYSEIHIAEQAVERAFHMTGVAAYLEYLDG